jgi:hypothetical protein
MADIANSRRSFIFVVMTIIQGFLFARPKEIRAAKQGAKDLVGQLEMEGLASSRPQKEWLISSSMMGEQTILYRENETQKIPVCSMNQTGKMILDLCDGNHSPKDICRLIVQRCQVSETRAERDVLYFLTELRKIGAIRL